MPRPRNEYFTVSAVIANAVIGLFGVATALLGGFLLVEWLTSGMSPFETVGIARPAPLWMAVITAVFAVAGGVGLVWGCAGYLYRCATGKVVRLSRDELKRHRAQLAERDRRWRSGH
ncbi:hypothetical protein [Microbacterium sp. HJ5]